MYPGLQQSGKTNPPRSPASAGFDKAQRLAWPKFDPRSVELQVYSPLLLVHSPASPLSRPAAQVRWLPGSAIKQSVDFPHVRKVLLRERLLPVAPVVYLDRV